MQWSLQPYLRHTLIHCSNVKIDWCSKPTTYICHSGTPLDKVTSNIKFWSLPSKWEIRNKLYTPRYIFANMNHSLNKATTPLMLWSEQSHSSATKKIDLLPWKQKNSCRLSSYNRPSYCPESFCQNRCWKLHNWEEDRAVCEALPIQFWFLEQKRLKKVTKNLGRRLGKA